MVPKTLEKSKLGNIKSLKKNWIMILITDFKYSLSDMMSRIIKICRGENEIDNFRIKLGFKVNDVIMTKE